MESKFITLLYAREEGKWLMNVLIDVPMWDKLMPIITIYYDS